MAKYTTHSWLKQLPDTPISEVETNIAFIEGRLEQGSEIVSEDQLSLFSSSFLVARVRKPEVNSK